MSDRTPNHTQQQKNPNFRLMNNEPEFLPSEESLQANALKMLKDWKNTNPDSQKAHPMDLSYMFE